MTAFRFLRGWLACCHHGHYPTIAAAEATITPGCPCGRSRSRAYVVQCRKSGLYRVVMDPG